MSESVERKSLLNNTIMLYLLTGSNYLFGLLSIPYLTRVLGAELYGRIGFGTAFYTVIQLILDFGFILSGTLDIAQHQDDHSAVQRIFSAVLAAKAVIIVPVFAITMFVLLSVERFHSDIMLFLWYFAYAVCNSLVPDFLYRGLENMTNVTIRNIILKIVFVICIFFFVKVPEQYRLVPVFYTLGSLLALVAMYEHVYHVLNIRIIKVSWYEIWEQIKKSSLYFLSRVATSVFSSVNTIVLGFVAPAGPTLGYYSATNNVVTAGRQIITPVTDSLFPNIVRTKDYRLMFKVAFWGEIIIIGGCILLGLTAEHVCAFVFGDEYAGMANMLRVMIALVPIALLSYLFGWAGLGSLGKESITNLSVLAGAFFHILILGVMHLAGILDPINICLSSVITQALIMIIRVVATLYGIKQLSA